MSSVTISFEDAPCIGEILLNGKTIPFYVRNSDDLNSLDFAVSKAGGKVFRPTSLHTPRQISKWLNSK